MRSQTCRVAFSGGERSWEFRNSPLNKQKVFDTDHIWTFHIHQHIVDLSQFTLHVLRHFDITHYLDGQPLQSMIKDRYAIRPGNAMLMSLELLTLLLSLFAIIGKWETCIPSSAMLADHKGQIVQGSAALCSSVLRESCISALSYTLSGLHISYNHCQV